MVATKPRTGQSGPNNHSRPAVVLQPETASGILRGVRTLTNAIRPTLGPVARKTVMSRSGPQESPEVLDSGALIARRVLALADRNADVGAMLLRQMLWSVYEAYGDGTATAALIYEAVLRESFRYLAAGGNAMLLRTCLEESLADVLTAFDGLVDPEPSRETLTSLAESIVSDRHVAQLLAESVDAVGPYGEIRITAGNGRASYTEHVQGIHWKSGALRAEMLTHGYVELTNAAVIISDVQIQQPADLAPFLQALHRANVRDVLCIAAGFSDLVTTMLLSVSRNPQEFRVVAVRTPGLDPHEQMQALEDMALVTGGQPVVRATGDSLETMSVDSVGHARTVWVDRTDFGIIEGCGSEATIDAHILRLEAAISAATDLTLRAALEKRLGQFVGGTVNLFIGGATTAEIDALTVQARQAEKTMRHAVKNGVVLGGGSALISASRRLENPPSPAIPEKRAAVHILRTALEAPIRALSANSGYAPDAIMAQLALCGDEAGFDGRTGAVLPGAQYQPRDAASVIRNALSTAVQSAALALTIDVVVRHRHPEAATKP